MKHILTLLPILLFSLACNLSLQANTSLTPKSPTPVFTSPPIQGPTLPFSSSTQDSTCKNKIGDIRDVTYTDDTQVTSGESFIKTWELTNAGTCTWAPTYGLVFTAGELMQGSSPIPLGTTVRPSEIAEVSVQLTAPDLTGSHRGIWMLHDANNKPFGSGLNADQPFWVQVIVNKEQDQTQPLSTGNAILKVDYPYYNATCPASLRFSGSITMSQPGLADYQLEMGSVDASYAFQLPDAQNHTFSPNETLPIEYPILLTHSVNGWARVHITFPKDISSDKVYFSVVCQ